MVSTPFFTALSIKSSMVVVLDCIFLVRFMYVWKVSREKRFIPNAKVVDKKSL